MLIKCKAGFGNIVRGENMSKRKKYILIFLVVLLNVFLIVGFLVGRDATMANDLKKEAKVLSKLDITKDRYNRRIRTRGNYGIVEKTAKSYLDDYAVSLQEMLNIMNDPKLAQLFSYSNYESDGPEFKSSIIYLESAKEEFNLQIDSLLKRSEEKTIKVYGKERINSRTYYDLYVEIVLSDSLRKQFANTKDILTNTKTKANEIFDISAELLNFLVLNKDSWKLEEGEIRFQTESLYNQYNLYVSRLSQ